MKSSRAIAALLLAALAHTSGAAWAASCLVSAAGVAFGSYAPLSGARVDALGSVQVTCSTLTPQSVGYTIALSAGNGTIASRRMSSGSSALLYNLYLDAARTLVWGDGSGGSGVQSDSYALNLTPVTRSYVLYGRIPGGQSGA